MTVGTLTDKPVESFAAARTLAGFFLIFQPTFDPLILDIL